MVAYRRQNCVGLFLSVWIFLLECEAWCRVSVVCDTIVGWSIQGTQHLNGCFRGARVKISRRIFPRIQCWKSWKKNKNRLQASVSKAAEVWTLILSLLKKKQNITLSTNIHIQITRKHVISIWSSKIRFSVVGKENTNRDTKSKSRHFQFLLPVVNSTHVWEEGIDPYFEIIPCIVICRLKFSFPPQQTMGLPKPSCLRKEISWGSGSCVKFRVNGSFKPFAPRFLRPLRHALNP